MFVLLLYFGVEFGGQGLGGFKVETVLVEIYFSASGHNVNILYLVKEVENVSIRIME